MSTAKTLNLGLYSQRHQSSAQTSFSEQLLNGTCGREQIPQDFKVCVFAGR